MEFEDLRAFLAEVDKLGELVTLRGADPMTDIGSVTEITAWSPDHPMILFDDIVGHPSGWRVAVHSPDSYRRMQLLYGFPDGLRGKALTRWWKDRLAAYQPVPVKVVDGGPVMENVQSGDDVDIRSFPAPQWHQKDAAPYLATGGASVLRDPETGRLNLGVYRGMVYDRNTIGHHLAAGHHGQVIRDKYFERGENCPIVISLGQDPTFTMAGAENMGFGDNELEYGGFIRGAPYEVIEGPLTGLPFLATAEAILEGEILHPDVEPLRVEGPWGEGLGYYAAGFPQPVVRVNAVYHRNDPIVMGEPTLRFRNRGGAGGFIRAARQWHLLERSGLEGIRGVGHVGPFLVISIKQYYSGHALRVADYAMVGSGGPAAPLSGPRRRRHRPHRRAPRQLGRQHPGRSGDADPPAARALGQRDQPRRPYPSQARHRGLRGGHGHHRRLPAVLAAAQLGLDVFHQRHLRGVAAGGDREVGGRTGRPHHRPEADRLERSTGERETETGHRDRDLDRRNPHRHHARRPYRGGLPCARPSERITPTLDRFAVEN